jgi:NADPH:quinone reductase
MQQVIVEKFGGVEELKLHDAPTPVPGPGEVRVALTSIGMNHAELMARRGEYRLSSGDPPFTPGLEGGGIIDAVGSGVAASRVGDRVILTADATRANTGGSGGTYRSHFVAPESKVLTAPDEIPDEQLGAIWLPYLTAWGCLVWKQKLRAGQFVAIPAASSSVGLAAAQVARRIGAITIGMTTTQEKADTLAALPESAFDHIIVTHTPDRKMRRWQRDIKSITGGHGADVFFDPVASGDYLNMEIRSLAQHGTIWVYGLLGEIGPVDVTPLIRLYGSIRGWVNSEIILEGGDDLVRGYREILDGFAAGYYKLHMGGRFALADVRRAHAEMERGKHIGKLILVP